MFMDGIEGDDSMNILYLCQFFIFSLVGDQLAANGVDLKYKSPDEIDTDELETQLETFHRESLKVRILLRIKCRLLVSSKELARIF